MDPVAKSNCVGAVPLFVAGIACFILYQKHRNPKPIDIVKAVVDAATLEPETSVHATPFKKKAAANSSDDLSFLSPISNSVNLVQPLVNKLSANSASGDIIIIGIAGGSGSGKTTLAKAIYESLGHDNITYIQHDSYYRDITHLTIAEREQQNFDHPDSLDTALLVEHVIALKNREEVFIPEYDFNTHSRLETSKALPSRPIVLIEGILIFSDPALYSLIDVKIFVDTDDDVRLIRRIQRDTVERGRTLKGVINQYITTVRPMHMQFVVPSKRNADIIVPEGLNSVALDLVVSRLKSHL